MAKAKQKAKKIKDPQPQGSKPKNGILFTVSAFLVAILIIAAVFGGVSFIVIKNNVNGFADRYRNEIKKIPLLNLALPKLPDPDDPEFLTDEEIKKKYIELRKEKATLLTEVETLTAKVKELTDYKTEQEALVAQVEQSKTEVEQKNQDILKREEQLKQDIARLNEMAANKDLAGFREFYEQLDPETSKKVYSEIVKKEATDAEIAKFIKTYEAMEPSASAKIFEDLGAAKLDLIISILRGMKNETSAEILGAMDSKFAAAITEKMSETVGNPVSN